MTGIFPICTQHKQRLIHLTCRGMFEKVNLKCLDNMGVWLTLYSGERPSVGILPGCQFHLSGNNNLARPANDYLPDQRSRYPPPWPFMSYLRILPPQVQNEFSQVWIGTPVSPGDRTFLLVVTRCKIRLRWLFFLDKLS